MTDWQQVINKADFPWYLNSEHVSNVTPFELNRCIFNISEPSYNEFLSYIEKHTLITAGDSVAEFGSGNASNLLYFKNKFDSKVIGIDISVKLIEYSKKIVPTGEFFVNSDIPDELSVVDHFISNSVFQYLPDYETACKVIDKMIQATRKSVLITDLKNIEFEAEFKDAQACRQKLSIKDFKEKYKNTPHLYFSKTDFPNATIIDMPASYPDSEYGTFSVFFDCRSK